MVNGQAGKGDRFRPVNQKKYAKNYDNIFGRKGNENNDEASESDEVQPESKDDE